jgi:hypothetical protein
MKFIALLALLALTALGQSQTKSGAAKSRHALTPEQQACKDRLKDLADIGGNLDALTMEKLDSIEQEINDCAYAESAGLSKDEIIAAYKLRDSAGKEVSKRIRDAAKVISDDDKKVREVGLKIGQKALDEDKQYQDLIQRYNALVDAYNGMLRDYKATVQQNGEFLDRMQRTIRNENYNCQMSALESLLTSATQTAPRVSYKPPVQVHCTTQSIPAAVSGLPSWTYTNCY